MGRKKSRKKPKGSPQQRAVRAIMKEARGERQQSVLWKSRKQVSQERPEPARLFDPALAVAQIGPPDPPAPKQPRKPKKTPYWRLIKQAGEERRLQATLTEQFDRFRLAVEVAVLTPVVAFQRFNAEAGRLAAEKLRESLNEMSDAVEELEDGFTFSVATSRGWVGLCRGCGLPVVFLFCFRRPKCCDGCMDNARVGIGRRVRSVLQEGWLDNAIRAYEEDR